MARVTRSLLWLLRIRRWSDPPLAPPPLFWPLEIRHKGPTCSFLVAIWFLLIHPQVLSMPVNPLSTILASPATDVIGEHVLMVPTSPKLSNVSNRKPHRNIIDAAQTRSLVPN